MSELLIEIQISIIILTEDRNTMPVQWIVPSLVTKFLLG